MNRTSPQRDAMRAEMMRLAARPTGASTTELGNAKVANIVAEQLVQKGLLFKVKFSHRMVRYYTDKRIADAVKPQPRANQIVIPPKAKVAPWSPDTPAIIDENTIFTVCPSPSVNTFSKKQVSNW